MPGPDGPRRRAATALLVAALAGLAAFPARAEVEPGPCGLVLTAEPARLGAEAPRAVRIRVGGPGPGAGAPGPPRLQASAGRLEGLRLEGSDWTAEWTAPEAGIPTVAILGALAADGVDCGFVAVPLDGVGDAVVRTRPGASVEVRIAERTFGPAVADPTGVALVPVEVPPGVEAAYHGARRIPLQVPRVAHEALLLGLAAAPADQALEVTVLVFAVEADGGARAGPPPTLAASVGVLGPAAPAGPGAWRVRWRLLPGPAAAAVLTARLPDEPPVEVALPRVAGPPAVARLTLDRARIVAGQRRPLLASVALDDAAGNATDATAALTADAGEVGPLVRLEAGRYQAPWTAPTRLDGRRTAVLTLQAGATAAQASVALLPGGPARLDLTATTPVVTGDGVASVELVATVTDPHGNPVDEPPARRVGISGEVGPPRQAGPGRFAMTYWPRPATAPRQDEVLVELPPLSSRLGLQVRPPVHPLALAASLGAARGPGGWLGVQAGAEVSAWRWLGTQEAGLSLAVAFTRLAEDGTAAGGAGPVAFSGEVRTLALLLSAGWRRSVGQRLALRLAAGGGAARIESLVAAGGGPSRLEVGWTPAASAAASIGLPVGPGRAFLEARATWLRGPGLATLVGAPSPLSLSLGYELDAP